MQKNDASQKTFGTSYFVRALPCIEFKNDVSLYLSVVCFSDCPQPKERDLLHTANTWHQCSGEKGDQLSVRISLEKKVPKVFLQSTVLYSVSQKLTATQ